MPDQNQRIGALVRRGVLLFSEVVSFPASSLVAAIGAAVVAKVLEIHARRVSEILSSELSLNHISYVEPSDVALIDFYSRNPVHPELAREFSTEIEKRDMDRLRQWYPFLYNTLVLKRQIPSLLFHTEIEQKKWKELATRYQKLSHGYQGVEGNVKLEDQINHFAGELLEVVNEVYEASKGELKSKKNEFAFDVIDIIREVATL